MKLYVKKARVVKLVDTADLKSAAPQRACRFDSGPGHHMPECPRVTREAPSCRRQPDGGGGVHSQRRKRRERLLDSIEKGVTLFYAGVLAQFAIVDPHQQDVAETASHRPDAANRP